MSKPSYTVIVNSCDTFEDCWDPFFTLFAHYFPNCTAPILLNTESKGYQFAGLDMRATQVGAATQGRRLTWSEALLRCLDQVTTDLVLYVQEDYFLNAPVDSVLLDEFTDLMVQRDIATVQVTHFGSDGPLHAWDHPLLWEIDQHAPYRIAMQAALWRTDRLRAYLRPHENAWQFEIFGSLRASRVREPFLCLNRDLFHDQGRQVLPYVKTGIIKGQWYQPAVEELFQRHHIAVDFSQRGFYQPGPRWKDRVQTISKLLCRPGELIKSLR